MTAPTETDVETTVSVRDRVGQLNVPLNLPLEATTAQDVIRHLQGENHIMSRTPEGVDLVYKLAHAGVELVPDQPLGKQGVQPGDELDLLTINKKG